MTSLLTIMDAAGKAVTIRGRAARLAELVALYEGRINSIVAGSVEFHMAPDGRVQVVIRETMEVARK